MGIATTQVRKHAIEAYESGKGTQAEIACIFGVSIKTLQRWLFCYRQTGRINPLPRGHCRASFEGQTLKLLDKLVKDHPDATLEQLRQMSGTSASIMSVKRALDRLGYRVKKNTSCQRTKP
jgi:transposase